MAIDKQLHLFAGFIIAFMSYFIAPFTGQEPIQLAIVATVVAAIGKELYDLSGYGTPEVEDALYTIMGLLPIFWFHFLWW